MTLQAPFLTKWFASSPKTLLIAIISFVIGTIFVLYYLKSQHNFEVINRFFVHPQNKVTDGSIQNENQGTCQVVSVAELVKFGKEYKYPNGVPRIIHYVYRSLAVPIQYSRLITECMSLNKDARFVFWSDDLTKEFVMKQFPRDWVVYKTYLKENVQRLKLSDINRYFILLKFGGIYMDMDTKCQKPFQTVMDNSSCILSTEVKEQTRIRWNYEFSAMNSLMACVPDHKFFEYLIKQLTPADNTFILNQTGPVLLTNSFIAYKSLFNVSESNPTHSISLAHSDVFSPHIESNLTEICRGPVKGQWTIQGCKDLNEYRRHENQKEKEAVAIHLFLHLGYEYSQHKIKKLNKICSTFNSAFLVLT